MTNDNKKNIDKSEKNEQVLAGKKAIETDKALNKEGKSKEQKDTEEQKDAETWHNEG